MCCVPDTLPWSSIPFLIRKCSSLTIAPCSLLLLGMSLLQSVGWMIVKVWFKRENNFFLLLHSFLKIFNDNVEALKTVPWRLLKIIKKKLNLKKIAKFIKCERIHGHWIKWLWCIHWGLFIKFEVRSGWFACLLAFLRCAIAWKFRLTSETMNAIKRRSLLSCEQFLWNFNVPERYCSVHFY